MADGSGSSRAGVVLVLVLIAAGEVYVASRWLGLASGDRAIAIIGFVAGVVGLLAFVWRVPRATPKAPWPFRPREGLNATGGAWTGLVVGASGVILSALLPFASGVAVTGFVAGLGFALVVLGGAALSLGYIR